MTGLTASVGAAQNEDRQTVVQLLHSASDAMRRGDTAGAEDLFQRVVTAAPGLSDAYLGRIPSIKKSFAVFKNLIGHSVLTSLLNIVLLSLTMAVPIIVCGAYYLFLLFHPPADFASV